MDSKEPKINRDKKKGFFPYTNLSLTDVRMRSNARQVCKLLCTGDGKTFTNDCFSCMVYNTIKKINQKELKNEET